MAAFNLSLSPLQAEYVARPGTTIIQAYEITNNSDQSVTLNTSVESWQPSGTDGNVQYTPSSNDAIQFSLSNANLSLGDAFVLRPGDHRQIVLKIKVSPDHQLSDTYHTFFVNKLPSNFDGNSTQSQILTKVGSHLLLSVSNQQNSPVKANITEFTTRPLIKDVFFTPIFFKSQINNTSSYFFKTFGQLKVTKNNKEFKTIDLQPLNVLANHSRSLSCSNSSFKFPVSGFCHIDPPFWPGAYTATLALDASASAATSSINFYVFPISPILVLLTLFAVFLSIKRLFTHRRRP